MEKLKVAPFSIATEKYVACASNKHITYFRQNKINFFLIHN